MSISFSKSSTIWIFWGDRHLYCFKNLMGTSLVVRWLRCHGPISGGLVEKPEPTSIVQLLSHVQLSATPWTAARQASLSFTISQGLLKLISIQPSHPLSSSSPPAFNLSQHQGLFQWVCSFHLVAWASFSIEHFSYYMVIFHKLSVSSTRFWDEAHETHVFMVLL